MTTMAERTTNDYGPVTAAIISPAESEAPKTLLDQAIREMEAEALDAARDEVPATPPLVAWADAGVTTARRLVMAAMNEVLGAHVVHDMALSDVAPLGGPINVDDYRSAVASLVERRQAFDLAEKRAVLGLAVVEIADLVISLDALMPAARQDAYRIVSGAMTALVAAGLVDDIT